MPEDIGGTEQHLSVEDLADREQVSVETVRTWNRTRTGPQFMKIGRHVRYRLVDVLAWEDGRLVTVGPAGAA